MKATIKSTNWALASILLLLGATRTEAGSLSLDAPEEAYELAEAFPITVTARGIFARPPVLKVAYGDDDVTGIVSLELIDEVFSEADHEGVWESYEATYRFSWGSLPHTAGTELAFVAEAGSPSGTLLAHTITRIVPNVTISASDSESISWIHRVPLVVRLFEVRDPVLDVRVLRNGHDVTSAVAFLDPEITESTADEDPSYVLEREIFWLVDLSAVAQVGDTIEFRATVKPGAGGAVGSSQTSTTTNVGPAQPSKMPDCVRQALENFLNALDVRKENGSVVFNGDPNVARQAAKALRAAGRDCPELHRKHPWKFEWNGLKIKIRVAGPGKPSRVVGDKDTDLVVAIAGDAPPSSSGNGKDASAENDMPGGGAIAVGGDGGSGVVSGGDGGKAIVDVNTSETPNGKAFALGGNGGDPKDDAKTGGDGGDAVFGKKYGGADAEPGFHGGGGYFTAYPAPNQDVHGNLGKLPNH